MKKWLLIPEAIAIMVAGIYLFIPAKLTISKTIIGNCNIAAANRYFTDTSKWIKWWPQNKQNAFTSAGRDTSFTYNGYAYKITGVFYNDVHISIQCSDYCNINSNLRIVQFNGDSVLIGWEGSLPTGNNPFKKIIAYRHRKEIAENMEAILKSFTSFIEEPSNIYGVDFRHAFSKDSTLVTMNGITSAYPTTAYIYQFIDSLKKYVASQGAKEINYPMLNVSKLNNTQFKTMVALSVNKTLGGNGRIILKRFVPWKMIEGEVHGGPYSVDKAFEQMFNFRDDNHLSIMAIPFQSLITDRSKEQDTTKWITKICAPIS
jgi:hypothetical protein